MIRLIPNRRRRCALLILLALSPLAPGLRAEGAITVFAAASLREALVRRPRPTPPRAIAPRGWSSQPALPSPASSQQGPRPSYSSAPMNAGWQTLAKRGPSAARRSWAIASPSWRAEGNPAALRRARTLPPRASRAPGRRRPPGPGRPSARARGALRAGRLTYYGLLPALKGRLLPADSVRTALAWVARGEAPLGLGYASDARVLPALEALAIIPGEAHPPIVYPLGRLLDAPQQGDGEAFEAFLRSPRARATWEKAGFTLLTSAPRP